MAKPTRNNISKTIEDSQREIASLVATVAEYASRIDFDGTVPIPVISQDADGRLGVYDASNETVLKTLLEPTTGITTEKVVIQKNIIVSSDDKNKQTSQEIDFNGQDFVADRDENADVIRISLKNRPDFRVFVSDSDPILEEDVVEGNFWFYSVLSKMYIRYNNFWIQPHPA